jgi:hypothetical protein
VEFNTVFLDKFFFFFINSLDISLIQQGNILGIVDRYLSHIFYILMANIFSIKIVLFLYYLMANILGIVD